MPLIILCWCLLAGTAPLLWLPQLPSLGLLAAIGTAAMLLLIAPGQLALRLALTLLFFCWAVLAARQGGDQRQKRSFSRVARTALFAVLCGNANFVIRCSALV